MAGPLDAGETFEAPQTIRRMLGIFTGLLSTVTGEQRRRMEFAMDDANRIDWDFIPKPDRAGLPMAEMTAHQKTIVHTLISASLSQRGYTQALAIMAMENILRDKELHIHGVHAGDFRNSDQYLLSFYGRPGFEDTWGWRLLGHHLSLSYTIIGQRWLTVTPCNMGAQPASAGVLNPLGEDEGLGFDVLRSLSGDVHRRAVIHSVAPADYATRQVPRIGKVEYPDFIDLGIPWYKITAEDREALKFVKDEPKGVAMSELGTQGASILRDLVHHYIDRMPEEIADKHKQRLEAEGPEHVHFAWAGGLERGTSHYYRVQTGQILIEFDNAIDNGNHIHSVWRDYRNDLGHDLLLDHYAHEHAHGHYLDTRLKSSVPEDD